MHDLLNNLRFVEPRARLEEKNRKLYYKAKPWTKEELTTLHKVYPCLNREEIIAALPARSWDSIKNKATKEKLKMDPSKLTYKHNSSLWSPEEDSILKIFWADSSEEDMLKLLPKRTVLAMTTRACHLRLCRNIGTFTIEERAIISQINILGKVELMRQLPNHSWNTISQYARNKLYIPMNVIPAKDLELLYKMVIGGYSNKDIETMLCISPQIRGRAIKALSLTKC